ATAGGSPHRAQFCWPVAREGGGGCSEKEPTPPAVHFDGLPYRTRPSPPVDSSGDDRRGERRLQREQDPPGRYLFVSERGAPMSPNPRSPEGFRNPAQSAPESPCPGRGSCWALSERCNFARDPTPKPRHGATVAGFLRVVYG